MIIKATSPLIYGASDDLVELESDEFADEWDVSGPFSFEVIANEVLLFTIIIDFVNDWEIKVIVHSTKEQYIFTHSNLGERIDFQNGLSLINEGRPDDEYDPGLRIKYDKAVSLIPESVV